MVLPTEVGDAAQDANRDRVIAWLDAGGSINDVDEDGYSLGTSSPSAASRNAANYRRTTPS